MESSNSSRSGEQRRPTRRRQFGLRTLLIAIAACAAVAAFVTPPYRHLIRNQRVAQALRSQGILVAGPLDTVYLADWTLEEAQLRELCDSMREVGGPKKLVMWNVVYDRGVPLPLKGLDRVQYLDLNSSNIDDYSLTELPFLPNLEEVQLAHTGITSHALELLGRCPSLARVDLRGTSITSEAIAKFRSDHETVEVDWP